MFNIVKFANTIENFGFIIKTVYVNRRAVLFMEIVDIGTLNSLYVLMPPGDFELGAGESDHFKCVSVSSLEDKRMISYMKYQKHLRDWNDSVTNLELGFKHDKIYCFDGTFFKRESSDSELCNKLLIFAHFKKICNDMTYLNIDLDNLTKKITNKILFSIRKTAAIEFITSDIRAISDKLTKYDSIFSKYTNLCDRLTAKEKQMIKKKIADMGDFYTSKDNVINNLLLIKDLRNNLLVSTDILINEIEINNTNLKIISSKLRELF